MQFISTLIHTNTLKKKQNNTKLAIHLLPTTVNIKFPVSIKPTDLLKGTNKKETHSVMQHDNKTSELLTTRQMVDFLPGITNSMHISAKIADMKKNSANIYEAMSILLKNDND